MLIFLISKSNFLSSFSYFSNKKFGDNAVLTTKTNCPKIKKGFGIVVSNRTEYNYLLRECIIVPFDFAGISDGITYNTKKTYELIEIFKIIYNFDLLNPGKKSKGEKLTFNYKLFKHSWEKKDNYQWIERMKKHKVKYLVAPSHWNINSKKIFSFKNNIIYELF